MYLVVTKRMDGATRLAGPYKTARGARRVARKLQKAQVVAWQAVIERGTRCVDSVWVIQGTFEAAMVPAWDCKPQTEVAADWERVLAKFMTT